MNTSQINKNGVNTDTVSITNKQFLEALFDVDPKSYINTRTIKVNGEELKIVEDMFHRVKDIDSLTKLLETKHFKDLNIYFGVCPRYRQKGKEEDVKVLKVLWCDVDCKRKSKPYLPTKEVAMQKIKEFKLPPSIIVDSGQGYHLYWILSEQVNIKNNTYVLSLRGVLAGLAEALGGDTVCKDLAHLLKMPNTLNRKPKDDVILPVKIIKFEPNTKYDIKEFEEFYIKQEEKVLGKTTIEKGKIRGWIQNFGEIELPEKFYELLDSNEKLKATWDGDRPDFSDPTRSAYSMSLASILVNYNTFTDDEIIKAMIVQPKGKLKDNNPEYLTYTLKSAKGSEYEPEEIIEEEEFKKVEVPIDERECVSLLEIKKANLPETEMIIDGGLIPKIEGFGMIGGETKEGKTIFALEMSLDLISGNDFLEDFLIKKKCVVAYIYHENTLKGLDKITDMQMASFAEKGTPIKDEDIANFYAINGKKMVFGLSLEDSILGNLVERLKKIKPDVIFLDPLMQFVGFSLNDAKNIKRFDDLMQQIYPCFWMLIHHYVKPHTLQKGESKVPPIYRLLGSSYLANACETFIGMEREGDDYIEEYKMIYFTVRHERTPYPMHLYRNPDTLRYEVLDSDSIKKGKMSMQDIAKVLEKSFGKTGANHKDLTRLCEREYGIKSTKFDRLLREAKEAGIIFKAEGRKGHWYSKNLTL